MAYQPRIHMGQSSIPWDTHVFSSFEQRSHSWVRNLEPSVSSLDGKNRSTYQELSASNLQKEGKDGWNPSNNTFMLLAQNHTRDITKMSGADARLPIYDSYWYLMGSIQTLVPAWKPAGMKG